MTGSDYPVLLDFESYTRTFEYLRESGLPEEAVDQILNGTAADLFKGRLPAVN